MPTFRKRGRTWRAEVRRKGIMKSATFMTKARAEAWAARVEADISDAAEGNIPNKTFGDLLDRYQTEISPNKKGARWELVRITRLKRDRIAAVRLKALGAPDVAQWRDRRLQSVSGASVRREWNLLSHACNIAIREWRWLRLNPFKGVTRPKPAQSRNRLMSEDEREMIIRAAITPIYAKVVRAMDFALETGMRAGEICGLRRGHINGQVAVLEDTKNGTRRDVPLSTRAIEILDSCLDDPLFGLTSSTLDIHWRNLVKLAGVQGLHFHDLRATAATRLSKKLNPFQLARMLGHKDIKVTMIYYRETAKDVANLL